MKFPQRTVSLFPLPHFLNPPFAGGKVEVMSGAPASILEQEDGNHGTPQEGRAGSWKEPVL